MQAYLLLGPLSVELNKGVSSFINTNPLLGSKFNPKQWNHTNTIKHQRPGSTVVASAATNNSKRNHYDVLGVSSCASSADIKRAYRALARKYHPDVSKDSEAGETFKVIRLAYDVLSNVETRAQYDQGLKFQENTDSQWRHYQTYSPEFDEGVRVYRWAELRRQMRREKYWKQYDDSSSFGETEEVYEGDALDDDRGSFSEVLAFTFFTLFFMKTIGTQFTLMLCSFAAMLDRKLDGGYKMGYLLAWVLGGKGGVLLTLCISFVSWACGKTSSSLVALMAVAMWVGTNLSRHVPLPQGALIALLYMSVKLQAESS